MRRATRSAAVADLRPCQTGSSPRCRDDPQTRHAEHRPPPPPAASLAQRSLGADPIASSDCCDSRRTCGLPRSSAPPSLAADAGRRNPACCQSEPGLTTPSCERSRRSPCQVRRSMHQGCLLKPRNLVFYPFSPIFRPFSASGRQESREHGQKSRGKREKIGKNRGK